MWMTKYLLNVLVEGQDRNLRLRELERTNAVLEVNLDWMRHRLNSVEAERAALLAKMTGVFVPVPEIQRIPTGFGTPNTPDRTTEDPYQGGIVSFDDVGDEAAAQLGIM